VKNRRRRREKDGNKRIGGEFKVKDTPFCNMLSIHLSSLLPNLLVAKTIRK
jgi:hypothetical protein